jgi:hypothetical protein
MITSWCQRWRERRDLYRPKGEVIQTHSYEVAAIAGAYRHPGTHRYVWALDKRLQRHLPSARHYPKFN